MADTGQEDDQEDQCAHLGHPEESVWRDRETRTSPGEPQRMVEPQDR